MHGQQGRPQNHGQGQQHRAGVQQRGHAAACDVRPQGRQRSAADFQPGQCRRTDQQHVGHPVRHLLFVGGQAGKSPVGVEAQQVLQRKAHQSPGDGQDDPVVCQQQHVHSSQHTRQCCHVARLAGLSLQVPRRKRCDDGAQQLHQNPHAQAHRRCLEPACEVQTADASHGRNRRPYRARQGGTRQDQHPAPQRGNRALVAQCQRHGGQHEHARCPCAGVGQNVKKWHHSTSRNKTGGDDAAGLLFCKIH